MCKGLVMVGALIDLPMRRWPAAGYREDRMTEGFERSRERRMPAQEPSGAIQPGWTVHDSVGRAIGNVADVEGEVLHVDGRPEGMGFLDVPLTSVREIEDGHVRLGLELEQIGRPNWTERSPARDAAQYGDAEAAF